MRAKVAINGFGRIGRMVCRRLTDHQELELVAINASYDPHTLAHLLKYDTTHGRFHGEVMVKNDHLCINGHPVQIVAQRDAALIPWGEMGVDIVIDATGKYKERPMAAKHLASGAKKVVITTATKDSDATVVIGVNDGAYDPLRHHVIAAASCTTNCLAPLAKVLHDHFGIVSGLMTSIHSFTNDQNILDNPHKDLRRARGAAQSIIPTTTGAARAVAQVLPELAGKLNGYALRVPTADVSVVDLVVKLEHQVTVQSVNEALKQAAKGPLRGILGFCDEPLVSADFLGDDRSCVIDALSTMVGPDNLVKVVAWYDNEWGYSCRVVDVASLVARGMCEAIIDAAD